MNPIAALPNTPDVSRHGSCEPRKRCILTSMRCLVVLFLMWMPAVGWAQIGREFVCVETYVGLARVVHVGKIVELEQIKYEKPLTKLQKYGKPYRMVFEVSETIRGDKTARFELVLSLQNVRFFDYMCDHGVEVMLVAGPNRIDRFPSPEVGIEEQGKRLDSVWYQFRLLTPVNVPKSDGEYSIASQLNSSYDSCRMFNNELEILKGREMILKCARAFAKKHSGMMSAVSIRVPNEFGALCGFPNAFCTIKFPVCLSTKKTLAAIKDDPDRIMGRIKAQQEDFIRSEMLKSINDALAMFSDLDDK